jgi:hypothetical protein
MAPQQLSDAVDNEVVSPCLGIHRAGLAEGGSHAVDKDDITEITRHTGILLISNNDGCETQREWDRYSLYSDLSAWVVAWTTADAAKSEGLINQPGATLCGRGFPGSDPADDLFERQAIGWLAGQRVAL